MPVGNGRDKAYGSHPYQDLKQRFYISLGLVVIVVAVSTVGFWIFQGTDRNWFRAFWETLNVISTVGSLDRMNEAERTWAMAVIIFGLGAVLYGFGNLTALLTSGEIFHVFERRKMERKISALSGHVIVCGFGNTGHLVADQLSEYDVPFVVIDKDPKQIEDAVSRNYMVIEDDCTREEVLDQAGVMRARGLVTTLENDAENVFVVLTAKGMAPKLHVVARADLPTTVSKLKRAGADHVPCPVESPPTSLRTPPCARKSDRSSRARSAARRLS